MADGPFSARTYLISNGSMVVAYTAFPLLCHAAAVQGEMLGAISQ